DTLLNNENFYRTTFADYVLFYSVQESVCYRIEEIIGNAAQLAVDTFRRPVAVYTESNYSEMFFPLLNTDIFHQATEGSEATLLMSMILQITSNNHCVTFEFTRKTKKILWTRPSMLLREYA
ncbi:hypothetical protein CU098_000373, partial [Rhizopus stolonifer]